MKYVLFDVLKGLVLKSATRHDDEMIVFETECGRTFKMFHEQECCESVYIEDVVGDLNDIVGNPILVAECVEGRVAWDADGNKMYTFYKIDTVKGGVTIRWNGSSNGCYSISVYLYEEV